MPDPEQQPMRRASDYATADISELWDLVSGLRERMSVLEAQRVADREHDRDSRHNQNEKTHNAIQSMQADTSAQLAEVKAQLKHQDECTDSVKAQVGALKGDVETMKSELVDIKTAQQTIQSDQKEMMESIAVLLPFAKQAARLSPIVVGVMIGAEIIIRLIWMAPK